MFQSSLILLDNFQSSNWKRQKVGEGHIALKRLTMKGKREDKGRKERIFMLPANEGSMRFFSNMIFIYKYPAGRNVKAEKMTQWGEGQAAPP